MRKARSIATVVLLLITIQIVKGEQAASQKRFLAGMYFSPKSIEATFSVRGVESFSSMVNIGADMCGVYNGKYSKPGVSLAYYGLFDILSCDLGKETALALYTGPGCHLGYVRDKGIDDYGLAAGLGGRIGVAFRFKSPFVVCIDFSAVLGCHITGQNEFENKMSIYKNGIYKAYFPQLGIKYSF